ncbi:hypothetical protein OIU77_026065 [Salix suchowensis]|uniref:Ribosomal protein S12 n=1 Tax=Salix suchowensis TaxID=1278906 RepID=A0ABQ9C206_9ROSI|nr:hypothetical protein OIU77_026065 [Salix suchowensis]
MPRGLRSCLRISSWLEGSGVKGLKWWLVNIVKVSCF